MSEGGKATRFVERLIGDKTQLLALVLLRIPIIRYELNLRRK